MIFNNSNLIGGSLRSHNCGELRADHIGQIVTLCGWLNRSRDLGGLFFIDIRDKYGLTQLNFQDYSQDLTYVKSASLESVILVKGIVQSRPGNAQNKDMVTGTVEVMVNHFEILSLAKEVPFLPHGAIEATEDLRLKYRYLDLRSQKLQDLLTLRSQTMAKLRQFFYKNSFTEVETPILYKSTPEGARDYLVPSRVHPGKVYALPQSPQILKQLLMIGGTDRYFQLCRCFRDEDLRADRQPEFTQVDVEVSYLTPHYIKNLMTELVKELFQFSSDFQIPEMLYETAMNDYGSDKPDVPFGLKHHVVTSFFQKSSFAKFQSISQEQGLIKAIFVPESVGVLTRKEIDNMNEWVKPSKAQGVAWFKWSRSGEGSQLAATGGIAKFIDQDILSQLHTLKIDEGSISSEGTWLFIADINQSVVHAGMDILRRKLKDVLKISLKPWAFLWVKDFPLLDYDEDQKRFVACHHPFTRPHDEDLEFFKTLQFNSTLVENKDSLQKILKIRAFAYDLVCNGYEMGGGSLRIHDPQVQQQMFHLLGLGEEELNSQFGFFVEALQYGTPPHGGIALGLDRTLMLLSGTDNIRDVIAFPKTTSASDLMSGCPSVPHQRQCDELHFQWKNKKE